MEINLRQNSVPVIMRPQMIRCICNVTDYDGYTLACNKCAKYCHAACFDIKNTAPLLDQWLCWICSPRQVDAGRAIRLQLDRLAKNEENLRNKQLDDLALHENPVYKQLAVLARETFVRAKSMKTQEETSLTLAKDSFTLLVAHSETLTSTPPVELIEEIHDRISDWSSWPRVVSAINQHEIGENIARMTAQTKDHLARIKARHDITTTPQRRKTSANSDYGVSVSLAAPTKMIEATIADPPQHKIYQNLFPFLTRTKSATSKDNATEFEQLRWIEPLPLIIALARSQRYRIQLLELSSRKRISDNAAVRRALEEDQNYIFESLRNVILSEADRSQVLQLDGEDAQSFLDLIQMAMDKRQFEAPNTRRKAERLSLKLCELCNILPSALQIRGVVLKDREAVYGGGFADIFRATYQGKDIALKRIRIFQRGQDRQKLHKAFCTEALAWQRLSHPHLLPFIGVDCESFSPFFCMISPWMQHGTIIKHLSENGNINITRRLFEAAQGLEYLHSENMVHGDLRGGNILINDEWQACLADFGLSVGSELSVATFTSHTGGSTRWMAPELHDPEAFDLPHSIRTRESDVYAFACVCLEVHTGRGPFLDISNDTTVMLQVLKGNRPKRPSKEAQRPISDGLWDLISKCWSHEFSNRPSISEVVQILQGLVS